MSKPVAPKLFLPLLMAAVISQHLDAQLTWWLDVDGSTPGTSQAVFDQITNSMNFAVDTYNAFSDYNWSHVASSPAGVRVVYQSSIPTANASYRGRIAFGGSRGGTTAMHELSHVLGVGTFFEWDLPWNRDSSTNRWVGEPALNELRDIQQNPNAVLGADGAHFWPYGLNGKDGDRNAHVRMVGALREDMGLYNGNPTNPVIARYTFDDRLTSIDTARSSTAAPFVLGSKILHSTISSTLRAEGNDPLNTNFADASNNGFTADFSVNANAGIDLDHMTFSVEFNGMDAGESGTVVLRSSADAFQTDLVNFSNPANGTTQRAIRVDLADFVDVTDLTFRFYFLGENNRTDERTRVVGPISVYALPTPCDFNGDGSCDTIDADALVAEIISPSGDLLFDLDADDRVTDADLEAWLLRAGEENLGTGISYLVGDANLDGVVDGVDFVAWNNHKFSPQAAWSRGDFDASGVVDGADFFEWNNKKFQSAAPLVVPEPMFGGSLALLMTAMLGCRVSTRTTQLKQ